MLTCREADDLVLAYLEGTLAREPRELFEVHLRACGDCVTFLENYRQVIERSRSACQGDDCDPLPEDAIRSILVSRRDPS